MIDPGDKAELLGLLNERRARVRAAEYKAKTEYFERLKVEDYGRWLFEEPRWLRARLKEQEEAGIELEPRESLAELIGAARKNAPPARSREENERINARWLECLQAHKEGKEPPPLRGGIDG